MEKDEPMLPPALPPSPLTRAPLIITAEYKKITDCLQLLTVYVYAVHYAKTLKNMTHRCDLALCWPKPSARSSWPLFCIALQLTPLTAPFPQQIPRIFFVLISFAITILKLSAFLAFFFGCFLLDVQQQSLDRPTERSLKQQEPHHHALGQANANRSTCVLPLQCW